MTAKLTPHLRLRNAQDFIENLAEGSHTAGRNHYIFIGRTKEWDLNLTSDPIVSETSPPTPTNTLEEEMTSRDHMIALKKVRDVDSTLVVKRFNWDSSGNTIYAQYDTSDPDLANHPTQEDVQIGNNAGYRAGSHYVITEDYNVFKCLSNGNGAKSTVKPTVPNNPSDLINSIDGYVWKYLFSLSNFQTQYFLTNQWIPVKKLTENNQTKQWDVQTSAVDGAIDSYIIRDGGSNYVNVLSGTLDSATSTTGTLPDVEERSLTDNAYVGCHIWITGGTGFPSGPFVITAYNAATRAITISGSWSVGEGTAFEILPRVIVSGSGSGATAKALVDETTKRVKQIIRISGGSNYSHATVSLTGGTTGTTATVSAQISPIGGHGADVERELNACYVMLTARLAYDDGSQDFPLSNDYRQIGLVRDVKTTNGQLCDSLTLRASKALRLTGVTVTGFSTFQPDEQIAGPAGDSTARGKVIAVIPGSGATDATIHYYQDATTGYVPFQDGMSISGAVSGATADVAGGGVIAPEIDKLSGDILYIDNRRAILRAPNQTEILRTVIKF